MGAVSPELDGVSFAWLLCIPHTCKHCFSLSKPQSHICQLPELRQLESTLPGCRGILDSNCLVFFLQHFLKGSSTNLKTLFFYIQHRIFPFSTGDESKPSSACVLSAVMSHNCQPKCERNKCLEEHPQGCKRHHGGKEHTQLGEPRSAKLGAGSLCHAECQGAHRTGEKAGGTEPGKCRNREHQRLSILVS